MGNFTSSTVPGCRAPHFWLDAEYESKRSLYDALGPDYTLLRFDLKIRVTGIVDAARQRNVPLAILDVTAPEAPEEHGAYRHKLVLVRPDQHVAWRGDEEPSAPRDLIDLVRGARTA